MFIFSIKAHHWSPRENGICSQSSKCNQETFWSAVCTFYHTEGRKVESCLGLLEIPSVIGDKYTSSWDISDHRKGYMLLALCKVLLYILYDTKDHLFLSTELIRVSIYLFHPRIDLLIGRVNQIIAFLIFFDESLHAETEWQRLQLYTYPFSWMI